MVTLFLIYLILYFIDELGLSESRIENSSNNSPKSEIIQNKKLQKNPVSSSFILNEGVIGRSLSSEDFSISQNIPPSIGEKEFKAFVLQKSKFLRKMMNQDKYTKLSIIKSQFKREEEEKKEDIQDICTQDMAHDILDANLSKSVIPKIKRLDLESIEEMEARICKISINYCYINFRWKYVWEEGWEFRKSTRLYFLW